MARSRSEPDAGSRLADSRSPPVRRLGAAARQAPAEPLLFFQEGLDWRFDSRGAVAARVVEMHATLLGGGALDDVEVAYPSAPTPVTWILDLALQHAGAVPRPLASGEEPPPDVGWVADPRAPRVEGGSPHPGSAGRWRDAREAEVAALATCVMAELPARGPWQRRLGLAEPREVVVEVLELERPLCRAAVGWILGRGGALVLAHERSSLAASLRWARATRLFAETDEGRFDRLVEAALGGRAGRVARLRSAVWSGQRAPDAAAIASLAEAGVETAAWQAASRDCPPAR